MALLGWSKTVLCRRLLKKLFWNLFRQSCTSALVDIFIFFRQSCTARRTRILVGNKIDLERSRQVSNKGESVSNKVSKKGGLVSQHGVQQGREQQTWYSTTRTLTAMVSNVRVLVYNTVSNTTRARPKKGVLQGWVFLTARLEGEGASLAWTTIQYHDYHEKFLYWHFIFRGERFGHLLWRQVHRD